MQIRNSFNSIRSFILPTGEVITDPSHMGAMAIAHFRQLLAPPTQLTTAVSPIWFQEIYDFRCPLAFSNQRGLWLDVRLLRA